MQRQVGDPGESPQITKASGVCIAPIMAVKVKIIGTPMAVDRRGLCRGSTPIQVRPPTSRKGFSRCLHHPSHGRQGRGNLKSPGC